MFHQPRRLSHGLSSQALMQQTMGQNTREQRLIGDYIVTQWIGAGSFAVVWKGRHKLHGTEVAIKEIATDKLNRKLQESLESEVAILERTDHPNIIRLLEIVKAPNRIFLVLEYCAGGDLSDYIRRTGRAKEVTARHFMRQLGSGLQVLRANNLIHRDLKPQNLLLSSRDDNAVLKIADFGFARSLQPQGLAETLCGSPLYMAPEILQFQKYDAKADLWSVGAILYELVTGRPPFGGQNHVQLLRNIERTEALLPPNVSAELSEACISMCKSLLKRNPVERLTFEEYFNHPFLVLKSYRPGDSDAASRDFYTALSAPPENYPMQSAESARSKPSSCTTTAGDIGTGHSSCQDECLPFTLDDEHQGSTQAVPSPRYGRSGPSTGNTERGMKAGQRASTGRADISASSGLSNVYNVKKVEVPKVSDPAGTGEDAADVAKKAMMARTADGGLKDEHGGTEGNSGQTRSRADAAHLREVDAAFCQESSHREGLFTDSMECIEREYVVVDAPLRMSSEPVSTPVLGPLISWGRSHAAAMRRKHTSPSPTPSPPVVATSPGIPVSSPVPIAGQGSATESLGSRGSTPSSHESGEVTESPSLHPSTRLASLQRGACIVSVIATDKLEFQQPLDALAVQLLALAIWREALSVCHSWASSAADGESLSSCAESTGAPITMSVSYGTGADDLANQEAAASAACATVEREFLAAVEKAENMGRDILPQDTVEMPDAVEIVFQSALAIGRAAAVEELMGNITDATQGYAKAAELFHFLLIEAPALPLTSPFVLSAVDRYRLRRYIESVGVRHSQCLVLSQQAQPDMQQHQHHEQVRS